MGEWTRCANCRYIRHVNDDARTNRDNCPRCSVVYEKAEVKKDRERRHRAYRRYRNVPHKVCARCDEPVAILAAVCTACGQSLKTPKPILSALVAGSFAIIVAFVWMEQRVELASPFPGLSDTHFESCVALSIEWVNAREHEGVASPRTIGAQNDWHSRCSRKALRDIPHSADKLLPASPQEWLLALRE